MRIQPIAVDYVELADSWYEDACRFKRRHQKIECLEHAIPLYESAEYCGYLGGQHRADACRRELYDMLTKGR